jgi:hypothetical protein
MYFYSSFSISFWKTAFPMTIPKAWPSDRKKGHRPAATSISASEALACAGEDKDVNSIPMPKPEVMVRKIHVAVDVPISRSWRRPIPRIINAQPPKTAYR